MLDVQRRSSVRPRATQTDQITTRADRLAADLADAIIAGDLTPGMRLDEAGLAKRYGVSRTPVREALRQLATSGLIDMRPRRGAVVTHVTSRQLDGLFVAMGELEATCARLAALSMTPIERRRLEDLHDSMAEVARSGAAEDYAQANIGFHSAIYAGAHNELLADAALGLRRRTAPFRRAQFRAPDRLLSSHAEHGVVLTAILRGDATEAHAAMIRHVNLVEIAYERLSKGD